MSEKAIIHASDCALHNAPAYEPGPCDCGARRKTFFAWLRHMDKYTQALERKARWGAGIKFEPTGDGRVKIRLTNSWAKDGDGGSVL